MEDTKRKLASVQRIVNIQDIEGKDKLKTCQIEGMGWQVLINTDLGIKEGDLAIYVEIDSVLPKKEEFAFLEKNKYRIKTMKMAGRLSEGIVFSLSHLPEGNYEVGQDVTELMEITKYESETERQDHTPLKKVSKLRKWVQRFKWGRKYFPVKRKVSNAFPSWIAKTDETRIQNIPFILEDGFQYEGREKIDGSSATYAIRKKDKVKKNEDPYEFVVCSRNVNLSVNKDGKDFWGEPVSSSVYHRINKKYVIEDRLREIMNNTNFNSVVIQGEIISSKIQGNKYKLDAGEEDFYMFNLDVDGEQYHMDYIGTEDFKTLNNALDNLKQAEVIYILKNYRSHKKTLEELLDIATYKSRVNPNTLAEGIVFRTYDGNNKVQRSFKVVSPTFLLKNKE